MNTLHNHIVRIVLVVAVVLLVPLVAMKFSDNVQWSLSDFVIIGTLVLSAGLLYELIANKTRSSKQRVTLGLVITFIVLLIWAELAVGVVGSPFAGN